MSNHKLAMLIAFGAVLVTAPVAHADHVKSSLGLEVTAVDPASRTVDGIQHCTTDDRNGRPISLVVTRDIDLGQFRPGVVSGVAVDPNGVILSAGPPPCEVRPKVATGGADKAQEPRKARRRARADRPNFSRKFRQRFWKFRVDIGDVAGPGQLDVTFGRILNLPKAMKSLDDKLIGEAGIVVLSGPLGIHRDGKPGPMGDIAKLKGDAVITARMLPRSRWEKDRHGEAVPTIQARDINLKS